jgi:transposase
VSSPFQPSVPRHSDPFLAEVIAQMQQQLDASSQQLQLTSIALANAELKIKLLEERLRLARIAKYGNASEKLSDLQLELLEFEPGVSDEEV